MSVHPGHGEKILRGIPVSAGVCRGRVLVVGKRHETIPHRTLSQDEIPHQIERLQQALVQTRHQIQEVQRQVSHAMGSDDASIFEAHLLVLEDRVLIDEVIRVIHEEKVNAEYAFHKVAEKYAATLRSIEDEYLRERVSDMRDVIARMLSNLMGQPEESDLRKLKDPCIIISYDLTPSTTALLDKSKVLGFATEVGSKTSHTAILARSLKIPSVVGLAHLTQELTTGQYVLLDGYTGCLILDPTEQTLFEYGQIVRRQEDLEERLLTLRDERAITLDGKRVVLSANLEKPDDRDQVQAYGSEGVGLFRTEYIYINRDALPTEEEQFQAYRQIAVALKPQPLVIRTLDLGGDKFLSPMAVPQEMNPFLGWRAIRFCLQETEIFRAQLRAILRASAEGNIKMMYPMVSGLDQLEEANALVEACKAELAAKNLPFDPNIEIGVMIEIPSAALIADLLAKRVRFLSLGTNDLIQYTLAVDRMNEKIAHLYEPTHPAILRLIKMTVDAGHQEGIWVGVCGEIAGDPDMVPLLLGLGVDELSAAAPMVPRIKYLIRRLKSTETTELAQFALHSESPGEILKRSRQLARRVAPGLFGESKENL